MLSRECKGEVGIWGLISLSQVDYFLGMLAQKGMGKFLSGSLRKTLEADKFQGSSTAGTSAGEQGEWGDSRGAGPALAVTLGSSVLWL